MTTNEQKTETLNLRVSRQFKAALKAAAQRECRSMANMVEFLVVTYCQQHNLLEMGSPESGGNEKGEAASQ